MPGLHLWKNLGRAGEPPHGWDVKDWLEDGDAAKLLEICCEIIPTEELPELALTLEQWAVRDLPSPDYLLGEVLSTTSRVLLAADTGIGKTRFSIAIGMRAAAGGPGRQSTRALH